MRIFIILMPIFLGNMLKIIPGRRETGRGRFPGAPAGTFMFRETAGFWKNFEKTYVLAKQDTGQRRI
jgi:hypothetical protein